MKTLMTIGALLLVIVMAEGIVPIEAAEKAQFSAGVTTNNGKKWRIAYYEGGAYRNYQVALVETVRGLMNLGWIEPKAIPPQEGEQTKDLWAWLVANVKSDYVEFVANAHYSANWDDNLHMKLADQLIERLNTDDDIDLLMATGTWAGKAMANNRHSTPTFVLSTSDPLSAGIIKSVEDSGFDHIHAMVDPYKHERQVRVFHEITGFKKLGVAFEDSANGRIYAAIEVIKRLSKERGFEIVPCHTQSDITDISVAEQSVIDCFEELVANVDAIYVTEQGGVTRRSIPKLAEIANRHHVPTFSQTGSEGVKYGFLASLSQARSKYVGQFHAETFAKVFNGAKPNQLDQLFQEPPKVAINLATAELIGFDPPLVLLGAADEIFTEIAKLAKP